MSDIDQLLDELKYEEVGDVLRRFEINEGTSKAYKFEVRATGGIARRRLAASSLFQELRDNGVNCLVSMEQDGRLQSVLSGVSSVDTNEQFASSQIYDGWLDSLPVQDQVILAAQLPIGAAIVTMGKDMFEIDFTTPQSQREESDISQESTNQAQSLLRPSGKPRPQSRLPTKAQ